jgi:hypothetical protein
MRASGSRLFAAAVGLGLLLSPAARAQEPAPALSRAQKEEFLRKAKILQTREIGHGVTNSRRVRMSDGKLTHDAHVQSIDAKSAEFRTDRYTELNFKDSWKFNVAAYRLGVMLGLQNIPVSVERKVGGSTSAVTWWIDDVMMDEADRRSKKVTPPDMDRWNRQLLVVGIFDQLIYNSDRNLRNIVIAKDWTVHMIDHTRAFRLRHELKDPKNLVRCERPLLQRLRELKREDMTRELRPYLTNLEIDAVLARRDLIVAHFDGLIREKGEAAVLYGR